MSQSLVVKDKAIVYSALHRERPRPLRWDVWPFAIAYVSLAYLYLMHSAPAPVLPLDGAVSVAVAAGADAAANATAAAVTVAANGTEAAATAVAAETDIGFWALMAVPVVLALHVLTQLMQLWSVGVRVFVGYERVNAADIARATTVRLTPDAHCGSDGLAAIRYTRRNGEELVRYIVFHSTKYIYKSEADLRAGSEGGAARAALETDSKSASALAASPSAAAAAAGAKSGAGFYPLEFPTECAMRHYQTATGLGTDAEVSADAKTYGANVFDIPLPTFGELFKEQATAPFFVFQVFCVSLWCLDEYWYYSLMTLAMLVVFEATVVKRRMRNLEDLREMRVPAYDIGVYRNRKWQLIKTTQLLPGDVCSVVRADAIDRVVPCDLLLLGGSAVVNEALLTGESVPQLKEAVDTVDPSVRLDIAKEHKRHVIFGGTKVLLQSGPKHNVGADDSIRPPPDHGCPAYVLRTGFNTGQGKLIRTILFGTERVSINNREALYFILFLLIFAVAAAGYVLQKGLLDPTRSRFKLLLNCIMIITSVVPPELPMELSLAVNNSLLALMKEHIYCTEPFRIPTAGAVDVCCFDKTGTLTSDDFLVKGVAGLGGSKGSGSGSSSITELVTGEQIPDDTRFVIAGCHSLAHVGNGLVGDPLEKAAFKAVGFAYSKDGMAVSTSAGAGGRQQMIRIVHRFAFSSTLKRMSCVVLLAHESAPSLRVVCKGAAEVMRARFARVPDAYDETHKYWSRQGARVLALGYKHVSSDGGPDSQLRVRNAAVGPANAPGGRDELESGLTFAGFLILTCPLKPDASHSVAHLAHASHQLMMITGDHVLTACSVATELTIATRPILILQTTADAAAARNGGVHWQSADERVTRPFDLTCDERAIDALNAEYDLCVSGDAMEQLLFGSAALAPHLLGRVVKYVCVFARTSPDMKEFVLQWLKRSGLTTLMCGDGTNDVGALKQAHIGVALIGHEAPEIVNIYARLKEQNAAAAATTAGAADVKADAAAADDDSAAGNGSTAVRRARGKETGPVAPAGARKPPPKKLTVAAGAANGAAHGRRRPLTLREQVNMAVKQMEAEARDEDRIVRLGDASIASPFTSKIPYIASCISIIRQGRCTLVTTLQMFQILALNCLVSAYTMSVLYLDGFKSGDTQMTVVGMSIAMFFLLISWSKPVEELTPQRPHTKLFTVHMMCAVMGQFALHMFVLLTAVSWANPFVPYDKAHRDPEGDFQPNVLNTVCFLVSTHMTVCTFLCNYQGRPFMASLRENKPLCYGLFGLDALLFVMATDTIQPLNDLMQLAPLPSVDFAWSLVALMAFDLVSTYAYSQFIRRVFALKPKHHARRVVSSTAASAAAVAPATAAAAAAPAADHKA